MRAIKHIAFLFLFLATVLSLLHIAPPPWRISSLADINVDLAFQVTLPYLLKHGAQYGPEAVFTYGPWGMLSTGYSTKDYRALVWLFNVTWILCIFLILWRYSERQNASQKLLAWLGSIFFPFLWATGHKESYFTFPVLFIAFTYFASNDVNPRPINMKGGMFSNSYGLRFLINILLGWAALAKFNIFVIASVINTLILIVDLWYRRIPILFLVFITSVLVAWTLAGQHLANLPIWILASLDLSNGYSDAMAKGFLNPYSTSVVIAFYLAVFLIVASGFIAHVVYNHDHGRIFLFFFIAFVAVVSIQHAMGGNQIEQSIGELLVTIWFLALHHEPFRSHVTSLSSRGGSQRSRWNQEGIWVSTPLIAAIGSLAFVALSVNFPIIPLQAVIQTDIIPNILALSNPSEILQDDRWASLLSEAHQFAPLKEQFHGKTIDIYPQHTPVVIGREEVVYQPRPAYLSLNSHTLRLAMANAQHLAGEDAPEIILFQILPPGYSVNNRYPALADGPSWPLLLTHYDLVDTAGEFLVLQKRVDALQPQLRLIEEHSTVLGARVRLPNTSSGLVWAEIEIKRTFLGKFIHMIYKSPHVLITVRASKKHTYQLVPALGEAGFLISPFVDSTADFAQLYQPNILGEDRVKFVEISSPDAPSHFWAKDITLRFYELSLPIMSMPDLSHEAER